MGNLGFRDGMVKAKALQLDQKRFKSDFYMKYVSSATAWKASATGWTSTAAKTTYLASAQPVPRNVKVVNNLAAASERAMKIVFKGYDAQGDYQEETLTLGKGVSSVTSGNVAFAVVTEVKPAQATKGYGTYGTVSLYFGDKVGLTEYVESESDILRINFVRGTSLAFAAQTSSVQPINSTTFSPTYQTVKLSAMAPAGSSISIGYLSKFQRKSQKQ